jgi:hypothetical protein
LHHGALPMPYPRLITCFVVVLGLLSARNAAAADTVTTTSTPLVASDFTFKFEAYNPDNKSWSQLNDTEANYFFNRARCECAADTTDYTGHVKVVIQAASTTDAKVTNQLRSHPTAGSGTARLYVGGVAVNCLQAGVVNIESKCLNLLNPSNYNESISGGVAAITVGRVWRSPPIPVARFFNSVNMCSGSACDATDICHSISAQQFIYLWADTTGTGVPDAGDIKTQVSMIGKVDLLPSNVSVTPGNGALTVKWSWAGGVTPSSEAALSGLQIFCVRAADLQVFEDKAFGQSYMTSVTTCPSTVGASGGGLDQYDPRFLCSDLLPPQTNEYRIRRLQNGIPYGVAVAVVDRYKNVSALSELVYDQPIPTVDFYTEYKDLGGDAQGGYCALAALPRSPGVLAAAGLVLLGLVWWRRRKRGGAGPLAVLLLASLSATGSARAQTGFHEDMDAHLSDGRAWRGSPRNFAVEARFGLYTPNVDSEFSGDGPKPHAFIFGNKSRPMWQLEFDWEILQVFGTFAVGGVVGYFKESAKACMQAGLDNTKGECTRAQGDNTTLRLIPLAALAIYRFDVLAEHWKIPLVPYGKIGLNYTLWKVTEGNGYTPTAGGGRGAGGTLGWQAAVGISLQLDFIDASSARAFDSDVGVNHTYIFFELAHIDSSGLGQSGKLHVGDSTWFAGLMFEF